MAAEEVVERSCDYRYSWKYIYPKGYLDVGCKKEELRITPIFWVKVTGKMELPLIEIGNSA